MKDSFFKAKDIKVGMRATVAQLSHILDTYMILAYDNPGDEEGTLVYIGTKQDKEYDSWFMQDKPITPIYHTDMVLETNYLYDEEQFIPYNLKGIK